MKFILPGISLILGSAVVASQAVEPPASPANPAAFPVEAYIGVGSDYAQKTRLADVRMTEQQLDAFIVGLRDAVHGRPHPLDPEARRLHDAIVRQLEATVNQPQEPVVKPAPDPRQIEAYMKEAVKNLHLQRSETGLAYGLMSSGTMRPGPDDTVNLSYEAVASDGKTELPRLSVKERRVKVSELLPGLAEAVQMMAAQGSAILVLPPELSYGDGPWPEGVAHGSPLIFMVKLHEIVAPK